MYTLSIPISLMKSTDKLECDIILNNTWSFYFHNPISNNWNKDGYVKISDISTVKDFWKVFNEIKRYIHNGMFFMMRDTIFPVWDDPCNKDGSFLSFKVLKTDVQDFAEDILINILGEKLLIDEYIHKWNNVNGISFSPKKNFCIVKIWMKSKDMKSKDLFNIPVNYQGEIIYKENTM